MTVSCLFALSKATASSSSSLDTEDKHESCAFWASRGECNANPDYMRKNCVASCQTYEAELDVDAFDDIDDDNDFNLETVKRRMEGSDTCPADPSFGSYPPIVKLPENYSPRFTLGKPDESKLSWTLDDLHAENCFPFAEYIKPPGAKTQGGGEGVAAKFLNFRKRKFNIYWDDGSTEGVYNGVISARLGARETLNSYAGHAFKFVDATSGEMYKRFVMRSDTHLYVLEPDADDVRTRESSQYRDAKREQRFMAQYFKHHNTPWLSKYGRPTPVLNMWPANHVGQTHTVVSDHPYWKCTDYTDPNSNCRGTGSLELNLTVVSKAPEGPRAFVIENLMSDAECDHILELGKIVVRDSMVGNFGSTGGFKSDSRTSSTGWLNRYKTEILKTIHLRFADVLGLDESILRTSSEELQVVRYESGQQYNPHHDFGDTGSVNQRFLTLLLYVQVPEKGGHTSFPKAYGGRGMRVKPPRGGAILFYSMLPDGNGDDLSLHAGEPVGLDGQKWVCNLWVWDPHR